MFHRGTYSANTLARNKDKGPVYEVNEPYQELVTTVLGLGQFFIDLGNIPRVDISSDEDEFGEDYVMNEEEDSDDESYDSDYDDDEEDAEGFNNDE